MLFLQEFHLYQKDMQQNSNQNCDVHQKSLFNHFNQNVIMHLLIPHLELDFQFIFLTIPIIEFYLVRDCD